MYFYDEIEHQDLEGFQMTAAPAMRVDGTTLILASTRNAEVGFLDSIMRSVSVDGTPVYYSIEAQIVCKDCLGDVAKEMLCTHGIDPPNWVVDSELVMTLYRDEDAKNQELKNQNKQQPALSPELVERFKNMRQVPEQHLREIQDIIVLVDPSHCADTKSSSDYAILVVGIRKAKLIVRMIRPQC